MNVPNFFYIATNAHVVVKFGITNSNSTDVFYLENIRVKQGDGYEAVITQASDYYPYGMAMPGRNWKSTTDKYRYGYQGSEINIETDNGAGNQYTTEFRQLDARFGRWFSPDPVFQPYQSPYNSMDGNPIDGNDVKGDCKECTDGTTDPVEGDTKYVDSDGEEWTYGGIDNSGNAIWTNVPPVDIESERYPEIHTEVTMTVEYKDDPNYSGWDSFWDQMKIFASDADKALRGKRAIVSIGVVMYSADGKAKGDVNSLPIVQGWALDIEEADELMDYLMAGKSGLEALESASKISKALGTKIIKPDWNKFQKGTAKFKKPAGVGHKTKWKAKKYKEYKEKFVDPINKARL